MVVNPREVATRLIETAPSPSASAISMAASTMRSIDSSRFGPRWGCAAMPQASATPLGSSGSGCSTSGGVGFGIGSRSRGVLTTV